MAPSASRVASRFHDRSAMLNGERQAVVLGAWVFDLRQGLNGRPGTVYLGGRPKPTKVTVDGDARLKLVGFAVPEVGFVEYDPDRRQVKVLSRTGTVLAYDNVNVRFGYTTSELKAAGKALSLASIMLLNDLKQGDAGAAQVREQERTDEAVRMERDRAEQAERERASRAESVRLEQLTKDSSWIPSLADYVGKARIQRLTLNKGSMGGPYQTSNTTTEQSSVDIGPWLRSRGLSGKAFAATLSRLPVDRMAPVSEHMGLREIRGAPIVRSNPVYSLSGDLLALTYRETIYYN